MNKLMREDEEAVYHLLALAAENLTGSFAEDDAMIVFDEDGAEAIDDAVGILTTAYGKENVENRRIRTIAAVALCDEMGANGFVVQPRFLEGGSGKVFDE